MSGDLGVELCLPAVGVVFAVVRRRSRPLLQFRSVGGGEAVSRFTWKAHHFVDIML